jgi:hypothetical protein
MKIATKYQIPNKDNKETVVVDSFESLEKTREMTVESLEKVTEVAGTPGDQENDDIGELISKKPGMVSAQASVDLTKRRTSSSSTCSTTSTWSSSRRSSGAGSSHRSRLASHNLRLNPDQSGSFWINLDQSGLIRIYLDLSRSIWIYVDTGFIYLDQSGSIRTYHSMASKTKTYRK